MFLQNHFSGKSILRFHLCILRAYSHCYTTAVDRLRRCWLFSCMRYFVQNLYNQPMLLVEQLSTHRLCSESFFVPIQWVIIVFEFDTSITVIYSMTRYIQNLYTIAQQIEFHGFFFFFKLYIFNVHCQSWPWVDWIYSRGWNVSWNK